MADETYRILAETICVIPYLNIVVGLDDPLGEILPVTGNLRTRNLDAHSPCVFDYAAKLEPTCPISLDNTERNRNYFKKSVMMALVSLR